MCNYVPKKNGSILIVVGIIFYGQIYVCYFLEKPYFFLKNLSSFVVSSSILTLLPYLDENRVQ